MTYDNKNYHNLDFTNAPSFFLSLKNMIVMNSNYDSYHNIDDNKILEEKSFNEQTRDDLLVNFKDAQKFGQIKQQCQALKNLGDYYLHTKNISLAVTYYETAFSFVKDQSNFYAEQNICLEAFDLALAEFIYQLLPKDNEYEEGLMVAQVYKARLRINNELKELFKYILSMAYYFAKAQQWQKAWHCARCVLAWVAQKPWKIDINLINESVLSYKNTLKVLRK